MEHIILGQRGELIAAKYLQKQKARILARNYKTKLGELDIIVRDKDGILIFVEVKTLSVPSTHFDAEERMYPEYHLTPHKLQKLIRLAEHYIMRERPDVAKGWRIDCIAIDYDPRTEHHRLRHLKNIGYE